jgi:formate hydrogenlyase subunit 3/multisubunit Na+/H+ antiporter MnhD subunit
VTWISGPLTFALDFWGVPVLVTLAWVAMLVRRRRVPLVVVTGFGLSAACAVIGLVLMLLSGSPDSSPEGSLAASENGGSGEVGFILVMNGLAGIFWCCLLAVGTLAVALAVALGRQQGGRSRERTQ